MNEQFNIVNTITYVLENLLRLLSSGNASHRTDKNLPTVRLLDGFREWNLIPRAASNLLVRRVSAGRDIEQVNAVFSQDGGISDGITRGPRWLVRLFKPIGGRDTEEGCRQHIVITRMQCDVRMCLPKEERHGCGDNGTDGIHNLEAKTDAVLEASSVLVRPLVRDGAEELIKEVSVRRVDLDHIESGLEGALGGRDKGQNDMLDALLG